MYCRNGYYYRSRRVGQRVRSVYVGSGPLAELEARLHQEECSRRAADREARAAEAREYQVLEDQIETALTQAEDLAAAALLLNGYHQHKRQWRKNGK